ncbi:hypothetical protein VTJ04DRAFT_10820 [Mycothermus thermophilus]|uniref:uncharacterized protein n=1 Tax=Humicola insolens TaxID=85995 RepID=UPI003742EA2A
MENSLSPLEKLPAELLQTICSLLPHRSLFALSLASRVCSRATVSQRFSHIHFKIKNKESLESRIKESIQILRQTDDDRLRYVRQVSVTGVMADGLRFSWTHATRKHWSEASNREPDDLTEDFKDTFATSGMTGYESAQHRAWLPLAEFLRLLPGLTDFTYNAANEVPGCILEALHRHYPHCRLHVSMFTLRSRGDPDEEETKINAPEGALLTSPCLYSVSIGGQRVGFSEDAVLRLLEAGYGSCLRHVHIGFWWMSRVEESPWPHFFRTKRRAFSPTEGQRAISGSTSPAPRKLAQLRTLTIHEHIYPSSRVMTWMANIDTRFLRRFEYHGQINEQLLLELIAVALDLPANALSELSPSEFMRLHPQFRGFPCLRAFGLSVRLPFDQDGSTEERLPRLGELAGALLSVLPPLEDLTLEGYIGSAIWEIALPYHGPTLRRLCLPTKHRRQTLSADKIYTIARTCPLLESARLAISRSRGSQEEVEAYRAIGHIPKLRCVDLVLNCVEEYERHLITALARTRIGPGQRTSELTAPAVDTICKTMVNFAVDETLARAIWGVVIKERADINQGGERVLPPLEKLLVHTEVPDWHWAGWGAYDDFCAWARWVGRSWEFTRADDEHNTDASLVARDPGVLVRPVLEASWSFVLEHLVSVTDINGEDIWTKIWPSKGGNWWEEWHSFPLDTTGKGVDGPEEQRAAA